MRAFRMRGKGSGNFCCRGFLHRNWITHTAQVLRLHNYLEKTDKAAAHVSVTVNLNLVIELVISALTWQNSITLWLVPCCTEERNKLLQKKLQTPSQSCRMGYGQARLIRQQLRPTKPSSEYISTMHRIYASRNSQLFLHHLVWYRCGIVWRWEFGKANLWEDGKAFTWSVRRLPQ